MNGNNFEVKWRGNPSLHFVQSKSTGEFKKEKSNGINLKIVKI
jgi:hypothetical protein